MNSYRAITTLKVINNEPFANGESYVTEPIVLRNIAKYGFFSLEYRINGPAAFRIQYLICSNIDGNFIVPAAATDIIAVATGHGIVSFNPILAPFMEIAVTCTGGGSITAHLNVQ